MKAFWQSQQTDGPFYKNDGEASFRSEIVVAEGAFFAVRARLQQFS